ncbi:SHOCT domain-containing protein [Marinilabilia salmonicolor]|jgi:putative membrane protein|uniref:Putative membrane protein n=1 Tax=Marinilabilia salmonicolor TaxID=989 RepID=A0A2T0WXE6_9BACT|nr:SHOCT domain-containing protein [Marinilabilia salmonicolor]PRY91372.1 putative membrane protein [Marinilabilia salmonicolor]RCW39025.1 putative membrane protein [Marinilabilia salmonicolor]
MMQGLGHGWGMGFGWIIGIIILLVILWLAFRTFRPGDTNQTSPAQKSPFDILKERYAKGEIDKEEFDQRKKDLEE